MSDWYYAVNNEQKGPVNESELKAQLASNKLSSNTLVWKEGMDNWTPASQVPAFTFREPPAPATLSSIPTSVGAVPGARNPESTTPISVSSLVGPGESLEVTSEDAETNKIYGILAYLGILWLVPLLAAKDSPFAKYHANQGLVLFLFWIALIVMVQILNGIFTMLGLYTLEWILSLLYLSVLVLLVIGVINAAAGKCVPLPVIGKFKLIK